MTRFQPHRIEWSPEQVRRFWDHFSTTKALEDVYFAKAVGRSLLNYVSRRIRIGTAVDIGCGRGDLVGYLLDRGNDVYAVDQSPESVSNVRKRFENSPHFNGAGLVNGIIDLPPASVDTAFLVEVVEHLDDSILTGAIGEARRVIRPGGHLVITTPNKEDLVLRESMCPECGGIFHRMQHVRSWSRESLSSYMEQRGFDTASAGATVLSPRTGPFGIAYRVAYEAVRKRKPHLIYIGQRR